MKIFSPVTLLGLVLSLQSSAAVWDGRVYDVAQARFLNHQELQESLRGVELLVLGEKHDSLAVQRQQAQALARVLAANPEVRENWVLGWEFLNRRDQPQIEALWSDLMVSKITAPDFLDSLLGQGRYRSYLPLLEMTAREHGRVRGVNLSREEKAPVVSGGLGAMDPSLIPAGFAMGGVGYRERFEQAMGGHTTPEKLENYFQAQCLTDDVMAHELLQDSASLQVLVTGSFHSDYFDGVVGRLRVRDSLRRILSVRFIDASEYTEAHLNPSPQNPIPQLTQPIQDPRYGELADWVWFAGEPH